MIDDEKKDKIKFNQLYKDSNQFTKDIFDDKSMEVFVIDDDKKIDSENNLRINASNDNEILDKDTKDNEFKNDNIDTSKKLDTNDNIDTNEKDDLRKVYKDIDKEQDKVSYEDGFDVSKNSIDKEEKDRASCNKKNMIVLNKVSIDNNKQGNDYVYNDGLDEIDDDRSKIKKILTDKKFILVVAVLIFIFTSITVVKTFYLRSKVDEYENFFTVIEEKESTIVNVSSGEGVDTKLLKKSAASELVNCINSKIDSENLPDNINNIIKEINDYYNQSNNYFAFAYKDIYTGFMVSYNENQQIFTASTIKGPTDIYIYEMASLEKINLDEELTYTGNYYNTGSGVLKNNKINTNYSVRTLLNYSTVYSDNAAHNMLMDKYGRDNMLSFWQGLGTNLIFTVNNNWGVVNAHDAVIYMSELYRFYLENDTYGAELMNNFLNAKPKFISGQNNYQVANKSGWSGTVIHDVSIVFANNPYIVVALSNLGDTDYYMSYFNKVNDLASKLHSEYWKYKMDKCSEISQY